MPALRSVIDPADLRWIWLTHTDFDHIGSLHQLLGREPPAPGDHDVSRRGHHEPVRPAADGPGLSRQPGREDHAGRPHADRRQAARCSTTRPRPGSTTTSRGRCSAPTASGRCSRRCRRTRPTSPTEELREGQVFWATVDSPWLHKVDGAHSPGNWTASAQMAPKMILSSHLPAAPGRMMERLSGVAGGRARGAARSSDRIRPRFEQMLEEMPAPA